MPYASLRALAAVHETSGIRAAARLLNVSHSAVCRHLRELEGWLQAPLFEPRKGTSKLTLTPQGAALARAAAASLSELRRAVDSVRERKRPNSVVIGTTASFAARWLIPRLPELQTHHGWIDVSVVPIQGIVSPREQGADVVIRMGFGPWPDEVAEPLMNDRLYPVARASYWAGLAGRSDSKKLKSAKLIHDRDPSVGWEQWLSAFPVPGLDLLAGPRFPSSDLALDAAVAGLGVALARGRLAQRDVDAGLLVRPFGEVQIELDTAYWLLRSSPRPAGSAEELVIEWIRRQAMETMSAAS